MLWLFKYCIICLMLLIFGIFMVNDDDEGVVLYILYCFKIFFILFLVFSVWYVLLKFFIIFVVLGVFFDIVRKKGWLWLSVFIKWYCFCKWGCLLIKVFFIKYLFVKIMFIWLSVNILSNEERLFIVMVFMLFVLINVCGIGVLVI